MKKGDGFHNYEKVNDFQKKPSQTSLGKFSTTENSNPCQRAEQGWGCERFGL